MDLVEFLLILTIVGFIGLFYFIRALILGRKRKKCIALFEKTPNAIKVFMYNHKAFRQCIAIKCEDYTMRQCNALLSEQESKLKILETSFNYLSIITKEYSTGLRFYISVNHIKCEESRLNTPGEIDSLFIYTLTPDTLNHLAQVTKITYKLYQNYENALYDSSGDSENAQGIRQYINDNNIKCFYHFTDIRNIESIVKNNGLYSWYSCQEKGITIKNPGGDELSRSLDARKGVADYVRLSFASYIPMQYRKEKEGARIVILEIHPSVATLKETLFSDENATSNTCFIGGGLSSLQKVNLNAIKGCYNRTDPMFSKNQAEILVKSHIPLKYILNITYAIDVCHFWETHNT